MTVTGGGHRRWPPEGRMLLEVRPKSPKSPKWWCSLGTILGAERGKNRVFG